MNVLARDLWRRLAKAPTPPQVNPTFMVLSLDLLLFTVAWYVGGLPSWAAQLLAPVLMCVALVQLYLLQHECVHRAALAQSRCNDWLGIALGFVLAYPFAQRRRSHLLHHVWVGHSERDPADVRAIARLSELSSGGLRVLDLLWKAGVPFLALNDRLGLWREPFHVESADATRLRARATACWQLAAYALLLTGLLSSGLLTRSLRLYLPAFWMLLMVEELLNLPHHLDAPRASKRLAPWEQLEVTHSCAHLPIWSALVLHFNLHTAHHCFPNQPWYRLPALERAIVASAAGLQTEHELQWSWRARRRSFREVFSVYFMQAKAGARRPWSMKNS